jgi:hypothetical protein
MARKHNFYTGRTRAEKEHLAELMQLNAEARAARRAEIPKYEQHPYGVGKFGGVEVIVQETSGTSWKFLGEVPATIRGWFAFLVANGATLPHGTYTVCGLQVYP